MTNESEAIALYVGTRIVAFDAAFRERAKPARVFDVTTLPPSAVAQALAEQYPDAHARFVFDELARWRPGLVRVVTR